MVKWPTRYFAGLSKSMKKSREKELIKRRKTGLFKLGPSNKAAKPRRSRWTGLFHKVYPGLKFKKNLISKGPEYPRGT